jgi:predicted lipoprotein with Yx(FWY)xxD motif
MNKWLGLSVTALGALCTLPAFANDAEITRNAEAAAPAVVASGATIYAFDSDGSMKSLRGGEEWFLVHAG